jgi:hypothetical protein
MFRAAYCRRQAALCRDMARQMSNHESAAQLQTMARRYDAEADHLEGVQSQTGGTADNDNIGMTEN